MKNEIEKLIKKYDSWSGVINEWEGFVLNAKARLEITTDLQSLLELHQSQFDKPLTIAFVQGAAWWEYQSTKFTMWASDKLLAEDEAAKRLVNNTLGKSIEEIINENVKDKPK